MSDLLQETEAPTETGPSIDLNATLSEWFEASRQLKELQARERDLRELLNKSTLFDQTKETGTLRHIFDNGYAIKNVRTEYVKVTNGENEAFYALQQMRALGEAQADRANRLFSFEPRLKETVYRELTDAEKSIVDPLITRKPGAPQLSIEEPKKK